MIRRLCYFVLAVISASILASCADTSTPKQDDSGQVSSIPWNRPQSWENGSNLPGGMIGTQ